MLQDIKRNLGEKSSEEYRRYITLQNKIRDDIDKGRNTFIERIQGVEMSLFMENIMEVTSASLILNKYDNGNVEDMVEHIMERKKMMEAMDQANVEEQKNHMSNFIAIISDPGRGDSKGYF